MTPLGVRKAWHRVGDFVYAVDEWFQVSTPPASWAACLPATCPACSLLHAG